jgi:hypothetical protein
MRMRKDFLCSFALCIIFSFFLGLARCSSHLNFVTLTVSNASSIGAEAMAPAFSVALEDMAVKYPILYQNYGLNFVSIAPPGPDACTPSAAWTVTEKMSQLYGSGSLASSDGIQIILTPGKINFFQ